VLAKNGQGLDWLLRASDQADWKRKVWGDVISCGEGVPSRADGALGPQSQNARAGAESAATPQEEALTDRPAVCPTKTATLADLYDALSVPPALVNAHAELDRAVDLCYRPQPFTSERQRVEYLFGLYEQLTAPLLPRSASRRPRKRVSN
jgi:hypothetical protein